jgi:two-component system, NtrC family, sensor kinase
MIALRPDMLSLEQELDAFRFLDRLSTHLKQVQTPQHAVRYVLRETREALAADAGCVAVAREAQSDAQILFAVPKASGWDLDLLSRFIRVERPSRPDDIAIVPVRRRGNAWAALAFTRATRPFGRFDKRLLTRVAGITSDAVQQLDRERMLEIRDRIDRKIREQLHPKDLFYQILDGLRSLTRYDHSSALLIRDTAGDAMEIAAEQIAWTKAKSPRIGRRLALKDEVKEILDLGHIIGFDRQAGTWHEWSGRTVAFLAEWLDFGNETAGDEWRERSLLCAPLVGRDGVFGVLKVAARHSGRLTRYDAELVERFRSQAAQAIDSLNRTESLEARMLTAERRHAMAELARGVSHDVNNALGSMLPLVQQMLDDVRTGHIDQSLLEGDLDQVQKSLQVCRRIFGGMLSFARGGVRRSRTGHVRIAIDTTLAILRTGIERRGLELVIDVPPDDMLPPVACGQSDLEQVLLNLLTNAREASQSGGRLTITARPSAAGVDILIADTGDGIAAEHLARVLEPFFTTKAEGNGLGLTICRSIVWEAGGTIVIDSTAGVGTRVMVTIPHASTAAALQAT